MAGVRVPIALDSLKAFITAVNGGPRQLSADEADLLAAYATRIVEEIEEQWPVDTGTSRDAWRYVLRSDFDRLGFEVLNDIDYVEYVHRKGGNAEAPLWREVIPDVVSRYSSALTRDMREKVAETQRRIAANTAQGGRGFLDIVSQDMDPPPRVQRIDRVSVFSEAPRV